MRAGELSAKQAACRATIAYSSPTCSTPATVATTSATERMNDPEELASPSLRRSMVSATAPPYSPKTTRGRNEQNPMSPTEKADPVMS